METSAKTAMNVNEIFMAIGKSQWFKTFEPLNYIFFKNQQYFDISIKKKMCALFAENKLRASMLLSVSIKCGFDCIEEQLIFSLNEF